MEIVVFEGIKERGPIRQVAYIIMYILIYGYIYLYNILGVCLSGGGGVGGPPWG
jgi:hypothetical protein